MIGDVHFTTFSLLPLRPFTKKEHNDKHMEQNSVG